MEISLKDTGKAVTLSDKIFGCEFKEPLIHQVITAYMLRGRAGTRAQKSRSEVSGGGKKPWKQKGSGRARAGTSRSPIWRGGGVTFAAKPQSYAQKVNKKMYAAAMRSILSELLRQDRLIVVENFQVESNKTKDIVKKFSALGLSETLVIADNVDQNLYLATRNLYHINVCDAEGIDPLNLVRYEKVLMTLPALQKIEESLS